ncbi:LysR family transcriptional regulator [Bacillus sp. JCM 19034]|uniref:LysR family transcriptional regulator n=1 Tax=Bacillus sp. JCM 19034 TaxID=1481928 RepID=UPI0007842BFA|nr:LysR family transcriptional regulator [Bacillus sp. JCM 19034]
MNIEVLQHFIKVYEKKSVNSAAKDLFITPQGLSKTIKQLELDLEAELFIRGPRGMVATECGELLHARAKHICYLMEDIKRK